MNLSLPENKTKLRINTEELLAKFSAGPVSVNGGEMPRNHTICVQS